MDIALLYGIHKQIPDDVKVDYKMMHPLYIPQRYARIKYYLQCVVYDRIGRKPCFRIVFWDKQFDIFGHPLDTESRGTLIKEIP
jgi:hypothetical protein